MKIAPIYDVKNKPSEYVQETTAGPVVIIKNGKPCAALVHLEEDQDIGVLPVVAQPEISKAS